LVLIDKETNQEKVIVSTGIQGSISGEWTSDGPWFIFAYTSGDANYYSQLLKVSSDGTELIPLTDKFHKSAFTSPIASPDKKKIAFNDAGAQDTIGVLWMEENMLYFYPLEFNVASSYGNSIVWSPDSEWIAFFSDWGEVDIRILHISTGTTYCVTQDSYRENAMDWR
jgi:Tol biopolymer transport system component